MKSGKILVIGLVLLLVVSMAAMGGGRLCQKHKPTTNVMRN